MPADWFYIKHNRKDKQLTVQMKGALL